MTRAASSIHEGDKVVPLPATSILRVLKYIRPYPWEAAGTLGCALLTTLAGFVFPKVTGLLVDRVLVGHHPELLWPYVLMVGGSFVMRDVLNSLRIRLNNGFEQKVIRDLRCDLYNHLQRLPLQWFENRATGDLLTRVSEDVTSVERVLIDGLEQGLVALLQIVGVGAILWNLNRSLTLWMIIPIPLMMAGAWWFTATAHHRYRAQRKATSALNSLLLDNLGGIRQIKSYAQEADETHRFRQHAEAVKDGTLQVMKAWAWYSPGMSYLAALGSVVVLAIGGREVLHNPGFTEGELVTFLLYVGMFYEPTSRLHALNQIWQAGRAAGERVFQILDSSPEPEVAGPRRAPAFRGALEFRDVEFAYRAGHPVLQEIQLMVEPGMTVALVGPTGAGKSTLVNLLPRFYEPTRGCILLDGQDHRQFSLSSLRSQIGLVSQDNFLFNATVLHNLQFGRPSASRTEVERAARAAHAHEFICALPEGYDTRVGERGVKLSGGEKQRISIARALLKDAPILILDEATASVDVITEKLIQEALIRLLAGRTSFIVAHRLSTIRQADLILFLRQGRIVECGSHGDLMALQGAYARLCAAQQSDLISDEAFVSL